MAIPTSLAAQEETDGRPSMIDIEAENLALDQALRRTEKSENDRNLDALLEEITEGAVLHFCGEESIQGVEGWRKSYEDFFKSGFIATHITSLGREIAACGDMAWEHGSFFSEFENPGGRTRVEGKYLGVFSKVDGAWKTAALSISGNG
jgi:ketosteroid isomerase-like protein